MDLNHFISLKIVFFLLGVLTITTSGQICSVPESAFFKENNTIDDPVFKIDFQPNITLSLTENPDNAFGINGSFVVAKKVLDFEALINAESMNVKVRCEKDGEFETHNTLVIVENINDNPPNFAKNPYTLEVNELSKVGTTVERIEAVDLDKNRLYYRLITPMEEFGLQTETIPVILVKKVLDYEVIKEVTMELIVQDTSPSMIETPSHTASTTVTVKILDINNRPPWLQPCTEKTVGTATVCLTSGYTGNVPLNEEVTGPLTLKPGPFYAIDGDRGRNDAIRYIINAGNVNDAFVIDPNSGNITMRNTVGVAGPIILTATAYELENPDHFATTSITLKVVEKSVHPPQFVKPNYEGFISMDAPAGSLVLESKTSHVPLQVQATDSDFTDGINPNLKIEVPAGSAFTITSEGFIIMSTAASVGTVNLQITVVDATNDESSTTVLSVEVTPERLPLSASINRTEDMVALGVSLAIIVLICFVVIGILAYNLIRFKKDWRKLSEASIFRSTLSGGSGGPKDGVQYTNEGFHADKDADDVASKKAAELELPQEPKLSRSVPEVVETQHSVPTVQNNSDNTSLSIDTVSQSASDCIDDDKDVKPILTKERRTENSYKAVWFKEDIDPNDREEVVLSDNDQDFEHEESDHDNDEDNDNDEEEEDGEDSNFAEL